jgi:hypothetical protein
MVHSATLSGTTDVMQGATSTAGSICSLMSYYKRALMSCKKAFAVTGCPDALKVPSKYKKRGL